ncbi:hypothetical protein V3O24_04555 [Methylobacter sp. Wu8]|uniref:hypothetical protein n=1 Tax=Methylobacter sp. Wu8 TaxID=3118457 RepID=UPI002F334050
MSKNNNTHIDQKRLIDRGIDELIGICKGILFDGVTCYPEAVNLMTWLNNNPLVAQQLPSPLSGNKLSADDEDQFLSLLPKITGSADVMKPKQPAAALQPGARGCF